MSNAQSSIDRERLGELFERALTLPPGARGEFLREACGHEPAMLAELISLVESYATAPERFARLAGEVLPAAQHVLSRFASPVERTVSHYQMEELVGAGGMGVVYRARDLRLGRMVALKFLRTHLSGDAEARARLESEARAASALDHPNIAVVHEIGTAEPGPEGEQLYIAMAYYPGQTLRQRIASGPLPISEILRYAIQIADGLARAHEAGIVHRDIKPANVLLTERGEAKILDFGMARFTDVEQTRRGALLGTVAYMSPEQTRGDVVDHRTDIWSFGCMLYEMLTRQRAFRGDQDAIVIHAIRHDEPEPVRRLCLEVPRSLARVVEICLAKVPNERYQTTGELVDALRAIEAGGAAASLSGRGRPTMLHVMGAAMSLAVVGVVAFLGLSWERGSPDALRNPPRSLELEVSPDKVAVLPFTNMSDGPADVYFSDGIAEEVLNALTHVPELRVVARQSSFSVRGRNIDIRELAERLGARWIVEGSVRRSGDRVRITAKLSDGVSGTQVWSDMYDRALENVFDMQEEIARSIAAAARNQPGELISKPRSLRTSTSSIDAYDRYLLGNHYYWQRGKEDIENAIRAFRDATEVDPGFAHAWATLSAVYNSAPTYGVHLQEGHPHDLAEMAAGRAVALDDTLGLAWMVLGNVKGVRHRDWETAALYIEKALEVSPADPGVTHWLAEAFLEVGRLREALEVAEVGYETDPVAPIRSMHLGCVSMFNGLYERAILFLDQARSRGLEHYAIWQCGWHGRLEAGDFDAAEAWLAERPSGASPAERAYLVARRNPTRANVRRAIDTIRAALHEEKGADAGNRAIYLLASLGATDEAHEVTQAQLDAGAWIDTMQWWLPSLGAFRRDPRFVELAQQFRLPGFWRKLGWPDACRPSGDTFSCE